MELRCEWNSSTRSLFTHTWLSSTYLNHHLGGLGVDEREKEASRGIVYKIKCKDCDCVYVGQTSRALKTRVKEHAKAIATLDKNSLLAKHHMLNGHQIDLESVEIVDRSSAWRQRLILEAWHSVRNRNTINEHIALPDVHNNILYIFLGIFTVIKNTL